MSEPQEAAKHVVDALSVGTVIASLAGIVPSIAALFTIIWTGIRIYETETVQKILGKKPAPEVRKE
jgi:hypothetical protein